MNYPRKAGGHAGGYQEKGSNANAAPARVIGEPFHNPYTFIPFPKKVDRFAPTPLTGDERKDERERKSGVLEISVKTLSPLMSCNPVQANSENQEHKQFRALTIGQDVVLPATSVRGSLRTLMTVLSGGTLGYMDEDLWLTQGRDAPLGPSSKMPGVPRHAFLAKVIEAGSSSRPGKILLGETKLIKEEILRSKINDFDKLRPTTGKKTVPYDENAVTWEVKLSGRPVNKKNKKEGIFRASGEPIDIPASFWKDYQGRNRHGEHSELIPGDLVWLEPYDIEIDKITEPNQIKSLQWARWGRRGKKLSDRLPEAVKPDNIRGGAAVDMVTDLFGQVHFTDNEMTFAGRIRPGNLVFRDCARKTHTETLAPLSTPHPGCAAFYYECTDLDKLTGAAALKGYKVYRNTLERGDSAPWKYSVQGVYDDQGRLKTPAQQKVNITAELLDEGCVGILKISFRSLCDEELALLLTALSVDWKLGGGKPLGLGHCRVTDVTLRDEDGNPCNPMGAPDEYGNLTIKPDDYEFVKHLQPRITLYRASQKPVDFLRYPRAVTKNNNKNSRGGHTWFARNATIRKNSQGIETTWTSGALKSKAGKTQIAGQALPMLDPNKPDADLLYGYDTLELDVDTSNRNQRLVGRIEKFDPEKHITGNEQSGGNSSQNANTRAQRRDER